MENKKLYRSNTNKIVAGICGGLGEYYGIDPTILRLAWILITIFSGVFPGLLGYFFAILVVPKHQAL